MSSARDKVRAYALEQATLAYTHPSTGNTTDLPIGQRGEFAGKAFKALQEVLTYTERADLVGVRLDPAIVLRLIKKEFE